MAGNSVGSCGYDEFRPLLEVLKSIDSLVIVHPDSDGVDMMSATANLVFSSEYLQERVFVIPDISRSAVEEIYGSLADSWLILDPDSYYNPEIFKNIYEQVRGYLESRSQISIHPWSESVLGFGGKYYEYCVSSLARRVSKEYLWPDDRFADIENLPMMKEPVNRAIVIPEISLL